MRDTLLEPRTKNPDDVDWRNPRHSAGQSHRTARLFPWEPHADRTPPFPHGGRQSLIGLLCVFLFFTTWGSDLQSSNLL